MKRHIICFATATAHSVLLIYAAFVQCGSGITRPHHARRGKTATVERLIGSIRRESLDHFIVFDEAQMRRVLKNYASYYNKIRTHLSLEKNAPHFRRPQKLGPIAAIPILGGLHHQYIRVSSD